jgi:hypothetical protein
MIIALQARRRACLARLDANAATIRAILAPPLGEDWRGEVLRVVQSQKRAIAELVEVELRLTEYGDDGASLGGEYEP